MNSWKRFVSYIDRLINVENAIPFCLIPKTFVIYSVITIKTVD